MKRVEIWDRAVNIRAGISLVRSSELVSKLSIRSQESELSWNLVMGVICHVCSKPVFLFCSYFNRICSKISAIIIQEIPFRSVIKMNSVKPVCTY